MKKIIFLFVFILNSSLFSQNISLDGLRREYQQVNKDSASCAKLYKKIIKSNSADLVTIAYRGAITASMANYPKNKMDKLKIFNSGKKLIEQSIAADSSNIETRFLRFTIQSYCPKALGYSKQITSDKNFILKNYSAVSNIAVKKMIQSFFLQSKVLTEIEKQKFE
ncbi:MAG: hypothetical protein NTX97_03090 [Bacteroidetes bacterium]|nr:hypothetical protein [Bacteroidota bacterium]